MAVSIRMARQGGKNRPQFMIVATNSRSKRDGKYLEKLGYYYPRKEKAQEKIEVNLDALNAWKAKGARVSQTVGQLLKTLAK